MISKIFEIPKYCLENYPLKDIFSIKKNGKWISYSTKEYYEYSNFVAAYFMSLGLKKGDRIATFTNNSPEWNFVDIGMSMLGIIHVPIHLSISGSELKYILDQIEAKYVFVSDDKTYKDILLALENSSSIKQVFSFEKIDGITPWGQIIKYGKEHYSKNQQDLEDAKLEVQDNDPVTLLYTSGTTGQPKGVLLSHTNLVSNLISASYLQPLTYKDKAISFLPLSHIYERTSNYQFQYSGCRIFYAESVPKILENMQEIKPDGFCAVPRVLEKIRNLYLDQGKELGLVKREIFRFSNKLINEYPVNHKDSSLFTVKRGIADFFVFRKLRNKLGGQIKFIGCGGAKLNPNIERFFWTAKLPVYQGYGLTETSPLVTLNTFRENKKRIGSIGPAIPDVSIKIAEDGEILCKGPNIMLGYYQDKEETSKSIDMEGWFHTGDIGKISSDSFLYIKGRKKSIFKTSYGKYVAPQAIESLFRESQLIEQIVVLGESRKFVSALIQPDFEYLLIRIQSSTELQNLSWQKLVKKLEVKNIFQMEINDLNNNFSKHEQIKKFHLVSDVWSIQSGELSQSLKLRRFFIHDKYQHIIENFYEE